jgi:hypothetical protein
LALLQKTEEMKKGAMNETGCLFREQNSQTKTFNHGNDKFRIALYIQDGEHFSFSDGCSPTKFAELCSSFLHGKAMENIEKKNK